MSVFSDMESALNTALKSVLPTTPIYFDNQFGGDIPIPEPPFLVCSFLPATPETLEPFYSGSVRYNAIYQITITVEKGTGKYGSYVILDSILAAFKRGVYLTGGTTTIRIESVTPEHGKAELFDRQLNLFEIPVTVACFATKANT